MVFALDAGPLHRPLGIVFGCSRDSAGEPALGWIGIERNHPLLPGAAAAAVLPPTALAAPSGAWTRTSLRRAGGIARGVLLVPPGSAESSVASSAAEAAKAGGLALEHLLMIEAPAGAQRRADDTPLFAPPGSIAPLLAEAGATRAAEVASLLASSSGRPVAASARGVVDGQGASILGLAGGRLEPGRRTALVVFLLTDALLEPPTLERLLVDAVTRTFATIAGIAAPLPADAIVALATGTAGQTPFEADSLGFKTLRVGFVAVAQSLVRQLLLAPLERARLVQITVTGAREESDAAELVEALAADMGFRDLLAQGLVPAEQLLAAARRHGAAATHAAFNERDKRDDRDELSAVRLDLGVGHAMATRWTAVPVA